jgi:hypothetical protein
VLVPGRYHLTISNIIITAVKGKKNDTQNKNVFENDFKLLFQPFITTYLALKLKTIFIDFLK